MENGRKRLTTSMAIPVITDLPIYGKSHMRKTSAIENLALIPVQESQGLSGSPTDASGGRALRLVGKNILLDSSTAKPTPSRPEMSGLKRTTKNLPECSFQWERFHQIAHELPPIFIDHWKELALNQDNIPLAPDWDKFYNLDVQGILRILTVRVEGHLVGYVFLLVSTHLHYATTLWAHVDMFFLDPVARQGWTGVNLFKVLIRDTKAMGAANLTLATKLHFSDNRVTKLLQRLGFAPIETVHSMRL